MSETETKRPTFVDERIAEIAAVNLLPSVQEWLGEEGDDILEQIADAIRFKSDGYDIAKHLEDNYYWSPNAHLVEILDVAYHRVSQAHEQLEREWVAENGITVPADLLNQRVSCRSGVGTVTKIIEQTAKVIVTEDGTTPGYGWVVPFETCTILVTEG